MSSNSHTSERITIIGGGVIGSCIAYFLANASNFRGQVQVYEPEADYKGSSTFRSAAAIRHQYFTPINVNLSLFSEHFFAHANESLRIHSPVDIGWTERAYLTLAPPAYTTRLEAAARMQQELGAGTEYKTTEQLQSQFTWLKSDGVGGGTLGTGGEGWINPSLFLTALRRKVEALGVEYIPARVEGVQTRGDRVVGTIVNGGLQSADIVVNAAGARAGRVARLAGIDIPLEARKRCAFVFRSAEVVPDFLNLIDPTSGRGIYIRPYGERADTFLAVTSPEYDPEDFGYEVDDTLFTRQVMPMLAMRVIPFERVTLDYAWAGHYEMNVFDQNAILGPHPHLLNFIFACGLSGHGVMHAPAIGRGIAEWISTGTYQTIDLSPLSFDRLARGERLNDTQASELPVASATSSTHTSQK